MKLRSQRRCRCNLILYKRVLTVRKVEREGGKLSIKTMSRISDDVVENSKKLYAVKMNEFRTSKAFSNTTIDHFYNLERRQAISDKEYVEVAEYFNPLISQLINKRKDLVLAFHGISKSEYDETAQKYVMEGNIEAMGFIGQLDSLKYSKYLKEIYFLISPCQSSAVASKKSFDLETVKRVIKEQTKFLTYNTNELKRIASMVLILETPHFKIIIGPSCLRINPHSMQNRGLCFCKFQYRRT